MVVTYEVNTSNTQLHTVSKKLAKRARFPVSEQEKYLRSRIGVYTRVTWPKNAFIFQ